MSEIREFLNNAASNSVGFGVDVFQKQKVSDMAAFNAEQPQIVSVCNFYGQGISISSDIVGSVGISIMSSQFPAPDISWDRTTWEDIKARNPMTMVVDFLGKAPDGTEFESFRSLLNMQTGELTIDGQSKGRLPECPADTVISAIDKYGRGRVSLPETVEEAVWKFVKDNISNFEWRKSNG